MEDQFSLINQTKLALPVERQTLQKIKNDILGEKYSLSIAFVGNKQSQKINKNYRKINSATNVLSFVLNKNVGEIIICPSLVKKETKKFGRNFEQLLGLLVIHGMLHLKGYEHGAKMEEMEEKYLSRTKFLKK